MSISNVRRLAICVALLVSFAQSASASDILIADEEVTAGKFDSGAGRRAHRRQCQLTICL